MQAHLRRDLLYSDVGADFKVTLPTLLRLFQDVAAYHSEQTGWGIPRLRDEGVIWVLNKLALDVQRYAEYGETLEIRSWSRGSSGVNMLRDFEIFAGEERVAGGSSAWFFFDRGAGRVRRVPEELDIAYGPEEREGLPAARLRDWAPYERFEIEQEVAVHARRSDTDASGHVNNVRYVDYLLDALAQGAGEPRERKIRRLRLLFGCEIDPGADGQGVAGLSVGWNSGDADHAPLRFKIHDGETQYARGDVSF